MKRFSVSCLGTYETCGYKCLRQYNKMGEDKLEDDKIFSFDDITVLDELPEDSFLKGDIIKSIVTSFQ